MLHKIKSAIEVILLLHDLDVVRYQRSRESMPFEHLRHDRVMIRKRPPAHSREGATTRKHFDAINHRGKRAQLKIRKTGAFASQLVEIRRQHRMSPDKSQ